MPELLWWRRIDGTDGPEAKQCFIFRSVGDLLFTLGLHVLVLPEQQVKDLVSQVDPTGWSDGIHGIPEQKESVADAANAGHTNMDCCSSATLV